MLETNKGQAQQTAESQKIYCGKPIGNGRICGNEIENIDPETAAAIGQDSLRCRGCSGGFAHVSLAA